MIVWIFCHFFLWLRNFNINSWLGFFLNYFNFLSFLSWSWIFLFYWRLNFRLNNLSFWFLFDFLWFDYRFFSNLSFDFLLNFRFLFMDLLQFIFDFNLIFIWWQWSFNRRRILHFFIFKIRVWFLSSALNFFRLILTFIWFNLQFQVNILVNLLLKSRNDGCLSSRLEITCLDLRFFVPFLNNTFRAFIFVSAFFFEMTFFQIVNVSYFFNDIWFIMIIRLKIIIIILFLWRRLFWLDQMLDEVELIFANFWWISLILLHKKI